MNSSPDASTPLSQGPSRHFRPIKHKGHHLVGVLYRRLLYRLLPEWGIHGHIHLWHCGLAEPRAEDLAEPRVTPTEINASATCTEASLVDRSRSIVLQPRLRENLKPALGANTTQVGV